MEINFGTSIKSFLQRTKPLVPRTTGVPCNYKAAPHIKVVLFDIYGTLLISASGDIDQASMKLEHMLIAMEYSGLRHNPMACSAHEAAQMILDALPENIKTEHQLLREAGHPYPEVDIVKLLKSIVAKLQAERILEPGSYRVFDLILRFEMLSNPVYPMPGMQETLQALHERGVPLGIVSNAQFYTPVIMNFFLGQTLTSQSQIEGFAEDLSVYSYKLLRAKPDTTLFAPLLTILANNYNCKPHEALFVGNDMLNDIATAAQAGLQTALFAGDARSLRLRENDERVKGIKPDFVIDKLIQLLDIVNPVV